MNAGAEGIRSGEHYGLPERDVLELLKVSTGDSWVVRNWSDVSEWTADNALAVLLKDLQAGHNEGLEHIDAIVRFDGKTETRSQVM